MKFFQLTLLLLLCACRYPNLEGCPALSNEIGYCLLPPEQTQTLSLMQKIQIEWKQKGSAPAETKQLTLLSVLEADPRKTILVMLNPVGQTLYRVEQDKQGVISQTTLKLGTEFDPAILLALVQWALWPADQVRQQLHERDATHSCLQVEITPQQRTISCGATRVLTVIYSDPQQPFSYQLEWFPASLRLVVSAVN